MSPLLLAAQEGAHEFGTGGVLAEWAGLMLVLPFVAFLLIIFFGKRLKGQGAEFAIGAMAIIFLHALALFIANAGGGIVHEEHFQLARIGILPGGEELAFELGWVVDGLSIMMYLVVATVSLLVFIYAVGYMKGDVRVTFFFAALSLFAGSMLVLVGAPNLVQLIIGWEGVGLASYLLIGHYWEDQANVAAGMKAFYVNKVADIGLILGTIIVSLSAGSFRITEILEKAEEGAPRLSSVALVGGLLLFFGAMGKSAQFPLHVWLPDAMAGPTPVSALMHAATMVTAGVYLVARMFPFYEGIADEARVWVLAIGAVTLLISGLLALVQTDIKRVLAYSTVSQLGYMTAALGAGGYAAGLFHLWTHAFFKALLFLGAGSVIHAVHSNHMTDMGGLRGEMPITYRTFVIGSLALAGIPPLAGFFSKDEILATFNEHGYRVVLWMGVLGAFITAFYMTRTVSLTFFGTYKGHGQPHESPPIMTTPLVILAGLAIVAGFVNIPGVFTGFHTWVEARLPFPFELAPEGFDLAALIPGLLAGLLGITAGYWLFAKDAPTQAQRDHFRVPALYPLLENKYYLDDLYMNGIVNPLKGPLARAVNWTNTYVIDGIVNATGGLAVLLSRFVYGGIDQRGIDGIVHGIGAITDASGTAVRRLQSGRVQQYAASFVAGAIVLVVGLTIYVNNT